MAADSRHTYIATEARAKYNDAQRPGYHGVFQGLDFWAPNINIFRDPRWGRAKETYGEDPYLTGCLAVPFIEGKASSRHSMAKAQSS